MSVRPVPEGYQSVIPYLVVQGCSRLIEFLKEAFGAEEMERLTRADGTIGHAQVRIGDAVVMLADARGEWKPLQTALYMYVADSDTVYRRALQAGATSVMEPADQFYGDRNAGVRDFAGNLWWIGTHQEDVSPEELDRRAATYMK